MTYLTAEVFKSGPQGSPGFAAGAPLENKRKNKNKNKTEIVPYNCHMKSHSEEFNLSIMNQSTN